MSYNTHGHLAMFLFNASFKDTDVSCSPRASPRCPPGRDRPPGPTPVRPAPPNDPRTTPQPRRSLSLTFVTGDSSAKRCLRRERGRSKRCPCERGGLRGAFASGGVAVKTPEASKKGLAVGLASAFGGRFGTVVVGCHQQMGILLLLSHSKFWAGW